MKLWIKTICGEKITADAVVETARSRISEDELATVLGEFADKFDFSSPVILPTHIAKLNGFNITRFTPGDFVHFVEFDALVIEVIKEKKEAEVNG